LAPQGKEIPEAIIDNMTLTPMIFTHSKAVGLFSLPKAGKMIAVPPTTQKEMQQTRLK
jgi:hypothetical protein